MRAAAASRNIAFWDEFDTVLDFIIHLHSGAGWHEFVQRSFAMANEHRMFTSRLLFATSYWLTGTVNFHIVGAIGNLFIVGACGILIAATHTTSSRIRLGVVLAFVLFQLENYENFLWSGASIDHFQVVMLALGSLAAVVRPTGRALGVGAVLAFLATFTLAHGCVTWPIAAILLAQQRRWRHLAIWVGLAILAIGAFLQGFQLNSGHQIADFSVVGLGSLVHYWLALLGGPMTFGNTELAPEIGLVLLVLLGVLGATGAPSREPVLFSSALFAIGALSLIAFGRSEVSGGEITSRYMILGGLTWALVIFMLIERYTPVERPYRLLAWSLPALALFNVSANAKFAPQAEGFAEARDRAALRYKQYGDVDGHGQVRLHPQEGHAAFILAQAREQGVYDLPYLCVKKEFPQALPSSRIVSYVDEKTLSSKAVYLGGWAMIPNQLSKRGQVHVVLRSKSRQLIYSAVTIMRPDVAKAYNEPRWHLSGFRFVVARNRLPAEDFQVGLLIAEGGRAEYVMTNQWLRLSDPDATEPWLSNDS